MDEADHHRPMGARPPKMDEESKKDGGEAGLISRDQTKRESNGTLRKKTTAAQEIPISFQKITGGDAGWAHQ